MSVETPPVRRFGWRAVAGWFVLALVVQTSALVFIGSRSPSLDDLAYRSPDADEYVSIARGLAWHGRYVRADREGNIISGPDTWRTPGYPLAMAAVIRVAGDSTPVLIAFQQFLTAGTVPLLWLILLRCTTPGWAAFGTLAWCFDPFRMYYSFWLMAESFFTLALLIWMAWWLRTLREGWKLHRAGIFGALSGVLVLIRPIALPLPLIALAATLLSRADRTSPTTWRCRVSRTLACAAGIAVVVTPWLVRNRIVAGHFELSHQSGASLAYHKAVDVLLWSQGRASERFSPAAHDEFRSQVDSRLQEKWAQCVGPATGQTLEALRWETLNYDREAPVDLFIASRFLREVTFEIFREHPLATFKCFAIQGLSMLVFPLGLLIAPPAGNAMPLSLLGGSRAAQPVALLIGLAYAAILLAVLARLIAAAVRRRWPTAFHAIWPALALFALSVPSEDPRFRLPIVPLMWIITCSATKNVLARPDGSVE